MTRTEIEAFLERHFASSDRRDADALAADHTIDGVIMSPIFTTVHGRPAIADSYRTMFKTFPDLKLTLDDMIIEAPRVAVFQTLSGTHESEFFGLPGTKRRIELLVARYFVFENGLIARERRIYDFTGMLVQLGVLRAKPARP
jgi:steroid delta-isomerase-like uncharacterized protein